jgi:hypothetical protein
MKKYLIILLVLFLGCSEDKKDCKCNAKMTTFEVGTGYFYINNLPIDCNTGKPTSQTMAKFPSNYIFVNCE